MCEQCEKDPEFAKNYDLCSRPGCDHYRCEHSTGPMRITYSKDRPEKVGQIIDSGLECMNCGCECAGFLESSSN